MRAGNASSFCKQFSTGLVEQPLLIYHLDAWGAIQVNFMAVGYLLFLETEQPIKRAKQGVLQRSELALLHPKHLFNSIKIDRYSIHVLRDLDLREAVFQLRMFLCEELQGDSEIEAVWSCE